MSYSIKMKDNVFVVKIKDSRATVEMSDELKADLSSYINDKSHTVGVVDLSNVEFIDSSILGVLVSGLKWATNKDGDLKIVGLQAPVRAMFELTRMYKVFEIYDTLEDSLQNC